MIRNKNMKKIIYILIAIVTISLIFTNISFAGYEDEVDEYKPIPTTSSSSGNSDFSGLSKINNITGANSLAKIGGQVIGVISVVAMVFAVGMLLVIGIKYMMASPDQKANLKARAVPYLIGAALIFGAANILRYIEKISTWLK